MYCRSLSAFCSCMVPLYFQNCLLGRTHPSRFASARIPGGLQFTVVNNAKAMASRIKILAVLWSFSLVVEKVPRRRASNGWTRHTIGTCLQTILTPSYPALSSPPTLLSDTSADAIGGETWDFNYGWDIHVG